MTSPYNYYLNLLGNSGVKDSTLIPRVKFLADFTTNINQLTKKNIIERLNRSSNPGTRWKNLMHVEAALKEAGIESPIDKELRDAMYQASFDNTRDTSKNKKQVDRFQPLEELQKTLIDRLNESGPTQELMMLAVYVLQPAIRNDWYDMKITTKLADAKTGGNWLHVRKTKLTLIMQEYKNDKNMGKVMIPITNELTPWLNRWIKGRERVFDINNDNSFGKALSRASQRVFGQPLTINDFRHIWEIAIQTDPSYATKTAAEKDSIHRMLLHSTEAAMLYNVV